MELIHDSQSGKTSPERSPATKAKTSKKSSKHSPANQFLYLDLADGQNPEWSDQMPVTLLGEYWTPNFGESPNVERGSTLSQILEPVADVPEKYYLSPRSCAGILRRAAKRGKNLPVLLQLVLEHQAYTKGVNIYGETEIRNAGEILRELRETVGAKTFKKWLLRTFILFQTKKILQSEMCGPNEIQTTKKSAFEKCGTCGSKNDHPSRNLFRLRRDNRYRYSPQGPELSEQFAGKLDEIMQEMSLQISPEKTIMSCLWFTHEGLRPLLKALSNLQKMPKAREETAGVVGDGINPASAGTLNARKKGVGSPRGGDSNDNLIISGVARTLNACKTGTGRLCADVDNFIIANTLTTEEGIRSPRGDGNDNLVMCIQHSIIGRKPEAGAQGLGIRDDGKSFTLEARGSARCIVNYTGTAQSDRIYDPAGVAPTMAFSHETGGPEITKILAFACNQRDEIRDLGDQTGAIQAQPGMKQQTFIVDPVLTLAIRGRGDHCQLETRDDGKANSLLTPSGGRAGIGVRAIMAYYRVRRLTPKECERLQNFPDNWTAGESDSARYRMLGNSLALPCPGYVLGNIADVLEREMFLS